MDRHASFYICGAICVHLGSREREMWKWSTVNSSADWSGFHVPDTTQPHLAKAASSKPQTLNDRRVCGSLVEQAPAEMSFMLLKLQLKFKSVRLYLHV